MQRMSAFPPHAGMGLRHGIRKDNRQKTGNQYDNDGNPQDYALPDIFNQIKNGMNKETRTPSENSQCPDCLYFDNSDNTCAAFPSGVPNKYLTGGNKHDSPDKDQFTDLVFQRKQVEY